VNCPARDFCLWEKKGGSSRKFRQGEDVNTGKMKALVLSPALVLVLKNRGTRDAGFLRGTFLRYVLGKPNLSSANTSDDPGPKAGSILSGSTFRNSFLSQPIRYYFQKSISFAWKAGRNQPEGGAS
jgi:hypothetical protein